MKQKRIQSNSLGVFFLFWLLTFALGPLSGAGQWAKVHEELVVASPDFKACHASTLVVLPSGEVLLAFFAGQYEGHQDVNILLAVRNTDGWIPPREVANGRQTNGTRQPCWNPVLHVQKSGMVNLYYKVGPNPREWWGMVCRSADGGRVWEAPVFLPTGILGPIKNKPVELAERTILSPSSTETDSTWQAHIEKSIDGGQTWRKIPLNPSSNWKVIQPSLLHHGGSTWQVICRSNQDSPVTAWSYDEGNTWGAYSKLPLQNPNTGSDAVTLRDGTHLLVYNPGVRGKEWFNNRNKLHVAASNDGIRWNDIMVLESGTTEEYSYPALVEDSKGQVHISYTYNRKNIKYMVLARNKSIIP